jgi:hypothetical protein
MKFTSITPRQRISIMKSLSTGTGLCIAGLCVVAFPFAQKLASVDSQAHAGVQASAMAAVASSATAQVTPTIVWYGAVHNNRYRFCGTCGGFPTQDQSSEFSVLFRAWSDGRVEAKKVCTGTSCNGDLSGGAWYVVSDSAQGLTYRSDINFDAKVDGADLGQLLADWGDAPRQDIPPSDCPLALINP